MVDKFVLYIEFGSFIIIYLDMLEVLVDKVVIYGLILCFFNINLFKFLVVC